MPAQGTNARADDVFDYAVTLTSLSGQEHDITDLVHSVQIHQSIFAPAMIAKLAIYDHLNFINTQPIIGEETIKVKFRSASAEAAKEYNFAVVGCDEFEFGESLMELKYTLWGASKESLIDYNKSVQKAYRSQPINDIVSDIYTTYLQTQKTITAEHTQGRTSLVIPNITPFQALEFLKKRAISAENPTNVFMSYETTSGFFFQTIANMIKTGKQKADNDPGFKFRYQHASLVDPSRESLEGNVIQFQQVRKFEVTELMQTGYFAADILKFDLDTAEVTPTSFKVKDKIQGWKLSQLDAGGKTIHTDTYMGQHTTSHKQYLIPFDPYRTETSMADVIAEKGAYYANLLQNQFEVLVPGADAIEAGALINIIIPEMAVPEASQTHYQNQTNGYFVVGDVIHTITAKSKFRTKMIAFKDSYSAEGEH